jgi:hypothetical protein
MMEQPFLGPLKYPNPNNNTRRKQINNYAFSYNIVVCCLFKYINGQVIRIIIVFIRKFAFQRVNVHQALQKST